MEEEETAIDSPGYWLYAAMHNTTYDPVWYMAAFVDSAQEATDLWRNTYREMALRVFEEHGAPNLWNQADVDEEGNICAATIFLEMSERNFGDSGLIFVDHIFARSVTEGVLGDFYMLPWTDDGRIPLQALDIPYSSDGDESKSDQSDDEMLVEAWVTSHENPAA